MAHPALSSFIAFLVLLTPVLAWAASPESSFEDSLADGDIDGEDVVVRTRQRSSPRPRGNAALSLVGFASENARGAQEVGGLVVLSLPLDSFARGSAQTTSFVQTSLRAAPNAVVGAGEPFDLTLTPRFARACVGAAWAAAGIGADEGRLESIVSRARWSAILPETRLRAIKYDSASLYSALDPLGAPTYFRDTTGGNLGLEARVTWRFDRLVYADDEPGIERIRMDHRDARSRVAGKTLDLLFHWQRASLDVKTLPPSQAGTRDEADVVLRLMEAEAALDVITNGWFTAHRPKRSVSSSL